MTRLITSDIEEIRTVEGEERGGVPKASQSGLHNLFPFHFERVECVDERVIAGTTLRDRNQLWNTGCISAVYKLKKMGKVQKRVSILHFSHR